MTKSGIILTSLLLLAIIGGALALKVNNNNSRNRFVGTLYCSTAPTTSCTSVVTGVSLALTTDQYISGYCTTVPGGFCTTYTYIINE